MTGLGRILFMFSVATLTLASPVYTRIWESPGLGALVWLFVLLQVLPTSGLILADAWLARRWRGRWYVWRGGLCALCLLSVARQMQVSFRLPIASAASILVAAGSVVGLGALVICGTAVTQRFLTAFAPGLLVWTVVTGHSLLPAAEGTERRAAPSRPRPVFVLLFDELDRDVVMPAGRVRPELTNFRRLVEGSRSFADATANYGWTCASVGSLLTGRPLPRLPPVGRGCLNYVPGLREDNLLSEVARHLTVRVHAQYLTYCFDAAFQCRSTAYVQARAPFLPLLQHYVPDELRIVTGADRMLGFSQHTFALPIFEQFLRGVRAGDARGTFHWLHVLLPHGPYVFDAHGGIHRPDFGAYWSEPAEYRRALDAYRGQVGFVDRLLGRFLDRLETQGLADEAIVVVTSDHGFTSLDPFAGNKLIDGFEASAARPRVPLIVRGPGVGSGVVADDYQHLDFRRLILRLIEGAGVPKPIDPPPARIFCDRGIWYVRDPAGQWQPRLDPDGRPQPCTRSAGLARRVAA